ncbi:MAG TPA: flagellar hook protein FlgE [Catenuloplanes sp.]|jgi:flagellar hook protein FlgE
MLRSLFSGISGLRAHQQMMDVTGNNIANVNTTGFKSSQSTFQDTLSQMVRSAGAPQGTAGGTNPAQIGLGVRLAGISTNFGQGSAQTTGKTTDLMIQGDGFFVVRSGGENLYTRAGAFDFDGNGNLVNSGGQVVQGWMGTNGTVNSATAPVDIRLPLGQTLPPTATTNMTFAGNLSNEAAVGATVDVTSTVYTATGATQALTMTMTKVDGDTWRLSLPGGGGTADINFTAGQATGTVTAGAYTVDVGALTTYSGASAAKVSDSDGSAAGTLSSYTISPSGEIIGVFSSGLKQTLGQVALANFNNVNGLEKTGESMFRTTVNSGLAQIGTAGSGGLGTFSNGILEMSNVDLAAEFTNLVIAQRGFQANSRVITTSDELLQELVNLKR